MKNYVSRYLEDILIRIHKTFKVLYLGGPRQVGKTTLLLHLASIHNIRYVSLDDLDLRRLAQKDPKLFLQRFTAPLFIDEVQYAPELFPFIKLIVDSSQKNGQYWLSGSQHFSMMENVRETLAGRIGISSLHGFSSAEITKQKKLPHPFLPGNNLQEYKKTNMLSIYDRILKGSFPALWSKNPPSLSDFYNSYIQTYIDRDLTELFGVKKVSEFHVFLELCAARTGQILNISELARDAQISVHAAKEWLSILEHTGQIYLLRSYWTNLAKRLIKSPKVYFLDTGLAAHLTKWSSSETLASGAMAGAFLETFAISEILKSYWFRGMEAPISYFRDKQGHEVDLLIEKDQKLYPAEIKRAASITHKDVKNITYLRSLHLPIAKAAIISLTEKSYPFDEAMNVIPVSAIS
jgi:uncharacterized protein